MQNIPYESAPVFSSETFFSGGAAEPRTTLNSAEGETMLGNVDGGIADEQTLEMEKSFENGEEDSNEENGVESKSETEPHVATPSSIDSILFFCSKNNSAPIVAVHS